MTAVCLTKPCDCGAVVTWLDSAFGWEHPDNWHVTGSMYVTEGK